MDIKIKFKDEKEDTILDVYWIMIEDNKIIIYKKYMYGYREIVIENKYIKYYTIERN